MEPIICPHCHNETLTYNDNIKGYTCKPCTEKYGVKGKCCDERTKAVLEILEMNIDGRPRTTLSEYNDGFIQELIRQIKKEFLSEGEK